MFVNKKKLYKFIDLPNISVAISGQIVECWVCSSLISPTGGGGRRVTVHRTKGQLQITQSGARQSTSRCTPGPPRPLSARAHLRPLHQSIGNPYPTATVVNDGFYITPGFLICCSNENDYRVAFSGVETMTLEIICVMYYFLQLCCSLNIIV